MPRKVRYLPSSRLKYPSFHKGQKQAYVTHEGEQVYFGKWPLGPDGPLPAGVLEKYRRFMSERLIGRTSTASLSDLTIVEACKLFLDHCEKKYKKSDQARVIQCDLRDLVHYFGNEPLKDFDGPMLSSLQDLLIKNPRQHTNDRKTGLPRPPVQLTRQGINRTLKHVRMMLKWANLRLNYPSDKWVQIQQVPPLKEGQTEAPESELLPPVPDSDIERVLPFLPPPVRAMVELQRLTGARPGEIVAMTMDQIDRSRTDGVWLYHPRDHKMRTRGRSREVPLGSRCQSIIEPFIREDDKPLFSPVEWMKQRSVELRAARKTRVQPSQQKRRLSAPAISPGEKYSVGTYQRAIRRACLKAGVEAWSPGRLRKNAAVAIEQKHGIDFELTPVFWSRG